MKYSVEQETEFPPLVRGSSSKNREEREAIVALLQDGGIHKLVGIEDQKEYNSLQQRIRNIAKSLGVSVKIQNVPTEKALMLQGTKPEVKEAAKAGKATTTK